MNPIVDRPWPIDAKYKKVPYKIRFTWDNDDSPIPSHAFIEFERLIETRPLQVHPKRVWDSYEAAVENATEVAESYINTLKLPDESD